MRENDHVNLLCRDDVNALAAHKVKRALSDLLPFLEAMQ
ncbi:hypothetical protein DFP81_10610 [Marinomonas pollencensis]|uniref:Uncharacterized protein n=1 Tax=Marinomonas pollencensis TaxID=491954 RepID=A0A3E0DKJ6_9GAMM|nr:hypothetical protein DFP81_10610 [Marinomonas pollencensis]